jgi:spermidine synthase
MPVSLLRSCVSLRRALVARVEAHFDGVAAVSPLIPAQAGTQCRPMKLAVRCPGSPLARGRTEERQRSQSRADRSGMFGTACSAFRVLTALTVCWAFAFAGVGPLAAGEGPFEKRGRLLEKRESLYNNIFVFGDANSVTMTFGQNKRYFTESIMKLSDPGALVMEYARYMTVGIAYTPKAERILEIGLGGGSIASYLSAALPGAEILTVELDKDVVELAKKHFRYEETARMTTVVADGRAFLMRDSRTWDMILLDAYRGPFVPFHLLTKEFYRLVKSRLNPGGVVLQNIEPSTMLFDSATATLNSVFPAIDFYDGLDNVVAVGYDGPSLRQAELLARAAVAQERHKLRYDLRKIVADRRVLRRPVGKVMSDDFAPVETLRAIDRNNEKWKEQTEVPR